ncbi:MAG: SDR family NAD(P)-dependent oxidoreductase [Pirellulaceae bacterium]|jgi:short-subunit dehydrogenase|nr:SDR family NAD(P)-dependent oxidoreductase [Pirellulaceae bacterium]HJN12162.1 SDR family NAD(P)-dependent oxidoreductase [Pirellulaceae bacterium]
MAYWTDKVAVVTGGSAGLGRVLSESLAAVGARVVLAARNTERLQRAVNEITEQGYTALGVPTDVTSDAHVAALMERTIAEYGRIDVLINSAGCSDRGHALETPPERFQELWELNFLATVRCCRAAAPHLIHARGHLVNVGSLASKTASQLLGAYPASKFPVAAYSQQLRYELGPQGVSVLLVCPGPIAREDSGRRYNEQTSDLPTVANEPGAGVKLKRIPPARLAAKILQACQRRRPELVMPAKAKLLFAIAQLSPTMGDWLLKRLTSS